MNTQVSETPAAEIVRLHNEIRLQTRTVPGSEVRIGELLARKKRELGHGKWLPWVKANLPFDSRIASSYMRTAWIDQIIRCLRLVEAYQLLTAAAEEPTKDAALLTIMQEVKGWDAIGCESIEQGMNYLSEYVRDLRLARERGSYLPKLPTFEEFLHSRRITPERFAAMEEVLDARAAGGADWLDKLMSLRPDGGRRYQQMVRDARAEDERRLKLAAVHA